MPQGGNGNGNNGHHGGKPLKIFHAPGFGWYVGTDRSDNRPGHDKRLSGYYPTRPDAEGAKDRMEQNEQNGTTRSDLSPVQRRILEDAAARPSGAVLLTGTERPRGYSLAHLQAAPGLARMGFGKLTSSTGGGMAIMRFEINEAGRAAL